MLTIIVFLLLSIAVLQSANYTKLQCSYAPVQIFESSKIIHEFCPESSHFFWQCLFCR